MNIYTKIELALADPDDYIKSSGILLGEKDATALFLRIKTDAFIYDTAIDEEDFYSKGITFMGKNVHRSKEPLSEICLIKKPR